MAHRLGADPDRGVDTRGPADALAHPVRLRLVQAILAGRSTAARLAELEDLGTTGQVYLHLRQLVTAGRTRRRPAAIRRAHPRATRPCRPA